MTHALPTVIHELFPSSHAGAVTAVTPIMTFVTALVYRAADDSLGLKQPWSVAPDVFTRLALGGETSPARARATRRRQLTVRRCVWRFRESQHA